MWSASILCQGSWAPTLWPRSQTLIICCHPSLTRLLDLPYWRNTQGTYTRHSVYSLSQETLFAPKGAQGVTMSTRLYVWHSISFLSFFAQFSVACSCATVSNFALNDNISNFYFWKQFRNFIFTDCVKSKIQSQTSIVNQSFVKVSQLVWNTKYSGQSCSAPFLLSQYHLVYLEVPQKVGSIFSSLYIYVELGIGVQAYTQHSIYERTSTGYEPEPKL